MKKKMTYKEKVLARIKDCGGSACFEVQVEKALALAAGKLVREGKLICVTRNGLNRFYLNTIKEG